MMKPRIIPEHDRPSPINPGVQLHVKEPLVFKQFAFSSQLWLRSSHSSMSEQEREKNTTVCGVKPKLTRFKDQDVVTNSINK